jgi:pimeloyl-ACP methyl ester carboxylesterase
MKLILRPVSICAFALAISAARLAMGGDVINQPTLTLAGAKRVAAAAISYARSHGEPGGSIAIVDAGGHTLYLERPDGTAAAREKP